jgi:hypothetical protein
VETIMPDPFAGLPPRFLRTPDAARFLGLSGRTLDINDKCLTKALPEPGSDQTRSDIGCTGRRSPTTMRTDREG